MLNTFFWGGVTGCVGSCIGSPLLLVKTQMQSYTSSHIAVGHQRKHTSVIGAFRKIYCKHGIYGLYRGIGGNVPRAFIGSGIQLGTFGPIKELLLKNNIGRNSDGLNAFVAGVVSGSTTTVVVTPIDILQTRLYNQPLDQKGRGVFYSGMTDCCVKIVRTEGFSALFKGLGPNFIRMTPHSTLVMFLFDRFKVWTKIDKI